MIRARLFNQKEKESFMITLKKKRNHEFGNELKDRLESLVVAFKTEEIAESAEDDLYIVDGGKKISGRENLESWLLELESDLKWSRSLREIPAISIQRHRRRVKRCSSNRLLLKCFSLTGERHGLSGIF